MHVTVVIRPLAARKLLHLPYTAPAVLNDVTFSEAFIKKQHQILKKLFKKGIIKPSKILNRRTSLMPIIFKVFQKLILILLN